MKQITGMMYKMHILVCVNKRENSPTPCCADNSGQEVYDTLKQYVRKNGLVGTVWVTRTRCLGFCNPVGTTIVIYPEKVWLKEVTPADTDQLIEYIEKRLH